VRSCAAPLSLATPSEVSACISTNDSPWPNRCRVSAALEASQSHLQCILPNVCTFHSCSNASSSPFGEPCLEKIRTSEDSCRWRWPPMPQGPLIPVQVRCRHDINERMAIYATKLIPASRAMTSTINPSPTSNKDANTSNARFRRWRPNASDKEHGMGDTTCSTLLQFWFLFDFFFRLP